MTAKRRWISVAAVLLVLALSGAVSYRLLHEPLILAIMIPAMIAAFGIGFGIVTRRRGR